MSKFEIDDSEKRGPRPASLKVLCVLSLITIGSSLFNNLSSLFFGPKSAEEMLESKVALTESIMELKEKGMTSFVQMLEKIEIMAEQINENIYSASITSLITLLLGLFGVIKMWQGSKVGFHYYIGYCLLSILGLYIYVSPENIPTTVLFWNLILSAFFIFLYSRNLKWMQ